jgi:Arc/MetJ family transcription regulator
MGRTNIVIDDELIDRVVEITGAKSKREAVHIALKSLVDRFTLHQTLKKLRGKLKWEGDLDRSRRNRQ